MKVGQKDDHLVDQKDDQKDDQKVGRWVHRLDEKWELHLVDLTEHC